MAVIDRLVMDAHFHGHDKSAPMSGTLHLQKSPEECSAPLTLKMTKVEWH